MLRVLLLRDDVGGDTTAMKGVVRAGRASARGFTLLEVLIALVLLGFLIAGLVQAARFGAFAASRQAQMEDGRADLDAVYGTLRRLIEQAKPGSEWAPVVFVGTDRSVAFTSDAPLPRDSGPVGRADVRISVDPEQHLILAWAARLHAVRVTPAPPISVVPLLDGVAQLDLAYWPAKQGGGWTRVWSDAKPPRLVRLRIVFSDGGHPAWPDLIVAPKLDPP